MLKRISFLLILALLTVLVFSVSPTQAQTYPAWAPNVAYAIGVQVTYQDASHPNHLYKCQQAHTSQVGWEPPNVPALWIDEGAYNGGGATNTPVPPTNTSIPTSTTAAKTNTPLPTATTGGTDGSPYSGTAYAIPGTVQAENYNLGGEGVAYHDSDTTNSGGQYRTADGVDIEATTDTGGGFNVGWTATGEWMKYTVNVTASGTYTLDFRVASAQTGSALHLDVDGANVSGSLTVPNTGGWQVWTDVTKSGVSLSAGQHVMRLFTDVGGMNYNWFSISGTSATATTVPPSATTPPTKTNTPLPTATTGGTDGTPYSGTPYAIPGKVEAENYNLGGEGVAYHDADTTNNGGQYRTADGVDIEATTDTGGGFDVGWTATGEWEKYTVNVASSGSYSVDFRVASNQTGSALHLDVDGANVTGSLSVPNTAGWQTWTDVTKSGVSLTAGQHVLRVFIDAGGMNINWFNITSGASATATSTFIPATNTTVPTSTTVATKTNTPVSSSGIRIMGYYADWDVYARNFQPKGLETSGTAAKINYLIFSFGNISSTGCAMGDSYADSQKNYDAASSVNGVADPTDGSITTGIIHQLQELKALHPGLKIIWSFGGWTWSGNFGAAAANAAAFANNCYSLVHAAAYNGTFDGIDIDWEYPNACGLSCDTSGFSSYPTLMSAIRSRFGSDIVTAAITADGSSGGHMDAADYGGAAQYVNWYNLMTYDYFGAWAATGPTAPHSPLTSYAGIPTAGFDSDDAVQKLKGKGVPASKIQLGIGFYGRGWTGVTQAAPGGSASAAATGTYEAGIEDYHVLVNSCPSNGTIAGTAYAFCAPNWWSYDTPSTIAGKMSYAKSQGLGGAFFWEAFGDTSNGSLITAMYNNR